MLNLNSKTNTHIRENWQKNLSTSQVFVYIPTDKIEIESPIINLIIAAIQKLRKTRLFKIGRRNSCWVFSSSELDLIQMFCSH